MNPLLGVPTVLQSAPAQCPVCGGRRVVQLRALAEPCCQHGGIYLCPQCTPKGLPGDRAIPFPLLPLRSDHARGNAA